MKNQKYRSLGLDIELSVPATVDEFDKNAKKEGACLIEAINNVVYRGSLAEFREVFLHGDADKKIEGLDSLIAKQKVVGADGKPLERKYKVNKLKDGKTSEVWDETEADYFKRVCAAMKVEPSHFASLAQSIASKIVFDASATERKPAGPKKLAEKYKVVAKSLLSGPNVKKFAADVKAALGIDMVFTGDIEKDLEPTGWVIKRWSEAQEEIRLKKLVGA